MLETFSDFRSVQGIVIPFKSVIMQGSQEFANVTVTDARSYSGLQLTDLDQKPVPECRTKRTALVLRLWRCSLRRPRKPASSAPNG